MPRTFFDNLLSSGLLADDVIVDLASQFASSEKDHDLANTLVDQGLLTRFQADKIAAGRTKGLVLDQYHLLDELGRGGFASVYKARHSVMNRTVAVKILAADFFESSEARRNFRREVLAITDLYHPNIVMAFDANETEDLFYLVLEYVDGQDLQKLVNTQGPLGIRQACSMLLQAARALQYAHERGLVHRDIKPANLLIPKNSLEPATLDSTGQPVLIKVGDFGLAKLPVTSNSLASRDKNLVGTPDYMSPEQGRNLPVDIRSDLYCLGCTFYFALSGRKPFHANNPMDVIVQHVHRQPLRLASFREDIPTPLSNIVHRLMEKAPEKRFRNPLELISELTFLLGSPVLRDIREAPASFSDHAIDDSASAPSVLTRVLAEYEAPASAPSTNLTTVLSGLLESDSPSVSENIVPSTATAEAVQPKTSRPSPEQLAAYEEDLPLFWNEWQRMTKRMSKGKQPDLSGSAYRTLYTALLRAARACCESAEAQARKSALRRLEDLVQPWVSLEALANADAGTLTHLSRVADAVNQELAFQANTSTAWGTWTTLIVLTMATVLGGFLLWALQTK